tara:strand:- start:684 stop:947 length:264 start_codon:yes stop_codon:yes gene_type:complete
MKEMKNMAYWRAKYAASEKNSPIKNYMNMEKYSEPGDAVQFGDSDSPVKQTEPTNPKTTTRKFASKKLTPEQKKEALKKYKKKINKK